MLDQPRVGGGLRGGGEVARRALASGRRYVLADHNGAAADGRATAVIAHATRGGFAPPALASAPPPVARTDESSTSGAARPNNVLLSFEAFRRAIGDMQRKGLLLSYREAALDRPRLT